MNTLHHAPRRSRGFTLVELLVVLSILAVLVTAAVPLTSSIGRSMKLTALSNALLSQLHLARSEAIKRNGRVAVCKSGDGRSCLAAGGWEQGWIVYHDANNNGLHDEAEDVVHRV